MSPPIRLALLDADRTLARAENPGPPVHEPRGGPRAGRPILQRDLERGGVAGVAG